MERSIVNLSFDFGRDTLKLNWMELSVRRLDDAMTHICVYAGSNTFKTCVQIFSDNLYSGSNDQNRIGRAGMINNMKMQHKEIFAINTTFFSRSVHLFLDFFFYKFYIWWFRCFVLIRGYKFIRPTTNVALPVRSCYSWKKTKNCNLCTLFTSWCYENGLLNIRKGSGAVSVIIDILMIIARFEEIPRINM